jgi:galactokinase
MKSGRWPKNIPRTPEIDLREQPKVQAKGEDELVMRLGTASSGSPMSPRGKQIELGRRFFERYGTCPALFRAPGRANLIGEHTDYNGGFVLPVAVDLYTWVAVAPRRDEFLVAYSENFDEEITFAVNDAKRRPQNHWGDYVRGVAWALTDAGYRIRGANLVICGEVPIGSGLSSSAAIEVATALALLQNSSISASRLDVAKICQRAENEFVGSRCGIMDQFVACHGEANYAVLLDCRSLEYQLVPLPPEVSIVVCNTMIKHGLANGEYNKRRADCEEAWCRLSAVLPHAGSLRDVSLGQLEAHRGQLTNTLYRRCHHVVSENDRVQKAVAALRNAEYLAFGRLMRDSHRSLRQDYEVSSPELDRMVELAEQHAGVYGARMMGGGFGGCTVNLVDTDYALEFRHEIARAYSLKTGLCPEVYILSPSRAAEAVTISD